MSPELAIPGAGFFECSDAFHIAPSPNKDIYFFILTVKFLSGLGM